MDTLYKYTIFYIRNGETRSYTFHGTPMQKDAEIWMMERTSGVTAVWFTE